MTTTGIRDRAVRSAAASSLVTTIVARRPAVASSRAHAAGRFVGERPLPLALWSFQGEYSINVPAVLASVVLTALPILALYVVGRRQLLSGLTAGFSR